VTRAPVSSNRVTGGGCAHALLLLIGAAVLSLVAVGCERSAAVATSPPATITVFAAASLTESFKELGHSFEAAHPGASVQFNFAGSQDLCAQLEHGAPADVFASASTKEMDAAVAAKTIDPASVKIFARNRLVVIYPRKNPGGISTLADLARPGLKIDIADPSVPAGGYTMKMLDAAAKSAPLGPAFKKGFLANVVSREENVKAVVSKVRLAAADAGVVYATDTRGAAQADLGTLEIPPPLNQEASYPIAVTSGSRNADLARQFEALVLSPQGQQVLGRYGFIVSPK